MCGIICLIHVYTCETITIIKILHKHLSPLQDFSCPSIIPPSSFFSVSRKPPICFPFLRFSYELNHARSKCSLCLVSFTQHHCIEAYPSYCIYQEAFFFLLLNRILCVNILQFTHSSVDGQLGSQLWAVTNKVAKNIHVQVLLWTTCFRSSWYISRTGMIMPYGRCMFKFLKKLPSCFPRGVYHFAFPPAPSESCISSTSSPKLGMLSLFNFNHCNKHVVASH